MKILLLLLLLLLLLSCLQSASTQAAPTNCADSTTNTHDVTTAGAFVDVYPTAANTLEVSVLGTSDGGAVYATTRSDTGSPRVVKVDSEAKFQWFSEQRLATGDVPGYLYCPCTIAEDSNHNYIYVAGFILTSTNIAFIIKYALATGNYVNSAGFSWVPDSMIFTLMTDSLGNLVFGGRYGGYYGWIGIFSKTTLAITVGNTFVSGLFDLTIHKIVEDPVGYYVYSGRRISVTYLCIGIVTRVGWSIPWMYTTAISGNYVTSMLTLSTGASYAVLFDGSYYAVSYPSGSVTSSVYFSGSYGMTAASSSGGMVLVVGAVSSSFAYQYDTAANCVYNKGRIAAHLAVQYIASSKHSSYQAVWVAGCLGSGATLSLVVKLDPISAPVSCSAPTPVNYLHVSCYAAVSVGCFGLCPTCVISADINACLTTTGSQPAVTLFAGRCATAGQHYSAALHSCQPVLQSSSCHPLCGGECLALGDSSQCAHHCSYLSSVDNSALGDNACKCSLNMGFDTILGVCLFVVGCHSYCGPRGCGAVADNSQCVDCAAGNTHFTVSGSVYLACCPANNMYSSGTCSPCHSFCRGCSIPSLKTVCEDCSASIANLAKTGTTAPVACDCKLGTSFDSASGMCVYSVGCNPLCLGGMCVAQNDPTACLACDSTASPSITPGTYAGIYTCTCPTNTVPSSGKCKPCHTLCFGCSLPSDNTACLDCPGLETILKAGIAPYVTCACADSASYDPGSGLCVYTSDCSPLCGAAKCTRRSDASSCVGSCNPTSVAVGTSFPQIYSCTCPASTTVFNGTDCAPILTSECYPLCTRCTESENAVRCISCVVDPNVVSAAMGVYYRNCTCIVGTVLLTSGVCGYTSECSKYCANACTAQHNQSACVGCATGIPGDGTTCACPNGTAYSGGACLPIMYETCHPLCSPSEGCVAPDDPSKCVWGCSDRSRVVQIPSEHDDDTVTCRCENGTRLNSDSECVLRLSCDPLCANCKDSSTCVACPKNGEGSMMILSTGKCICLADYVMLQVDGVYMCAKKSTTASEATEHTG